MNSRLAKARHLSGEEEAGLRESFQVAVEDVAREQEKAYPFLDAQGDGVLRGPPRPARGSAKTRDRRSTIEPTERAIDMEIRSVRTRPSARRL